MTTHPVKHDEEVSNCHNCGAAVSYHYCAVCGQETTLHVASAGEFIHEFVGHYVALEGRLWKTVQKLLFSPGFLSAEYIAGRRARYVQPLRVYLTFSILFFFVLKLAGAPVGRVDDAGPAPVPVAAATQHNHPKKTEAGLGAAILQAAPASLAAKFNAFIARPEAEQTKVLTTAFSPTFPTRCSS